MSAPRFLHRAYAWLWGYFWLPCPACGRMFGGHETGGHMNLPVSGSIGLGWATCRKCPGNYSAEDYGLTEADW
jgi:hypothetical protein